MPLPLGLLLGKAVLDLGWSLFKKEQKKAAGLSTVESLFQASKDQMQDVQRLGEETLGEQTAAWGKSGLGLAGTGKALARQTVADIKTDKDRTRRLAEQQARAIMAEYGIGKYDRKWWNRQFRSLR